MGICEVYQYRNVRRRTRGRPELISLTTIEQPKMAADEDQLPWNMDVASLMILVGESEEESYRLSYRSWPESFLTVPVVGLQNYVRPYNFLLDTSKAGYFSPEGVKKAPLRCMPLSNTIKEQEPAGGLCYRHHGPNYHQSSLRIRLSRHRG